MRSSGVSTLELFYFVNVKTHTMRPLIIDDTLRKNIEELVSYAEKNPFSFDDLLDVHNGDGEVAGDMEGYTLELPFGYRVVFSIEQQPVGDVRHLSMSVNTPGKLPSIIAVKEIMSLIGFEKDIEHCTVSMESIGDDHKAVNVLELINE